MPRRAEFLDLPAAQLKDAPHQQTHHHRSIARGRVSAQAGKVNSGYIQVVVPNAEPRYNPAALSPAIAGLFESGAVAAELREGGDAALLYPPEAAACARFAPKRVAEFAAGRLCARRALAELGVTGFPLAANSDRSPRWPSMVVGSITHTNRFCAAVVADAHAVSGLGVDAETIGRITPQIRSLIYTSRDAELLDSVGDDAQRARASTIVFSAKEAFYKCQYQITRAWRDFHDVWIELASPEDGGGDFVVHPSSTTLVTEWGLELPLRGRFIVDGPLVVTGISAARTGFSRVGGG